MKTWRTHMLLILLAASSAGTAQTSAPVVTSWKLNTTGEKGYNNIPSNVQQIRYSDDWVYISCTCIPGYDIGPWAGNPNKPANQNFVFKITRHPSPNTGTPTATPLGHTGVWSNGVSMFNAQDARSYNNGRVWNQNAIVVEGPGFDECLGHPQQNGEYHHHLNPRCLYDSHDSLHHSPIIGYAFDGYPIYGAYGFKNTDGSGGITRMRSSYRMRSITNRTTLPDGTQLQANQYGPDVSTQYPLGYYVEDFEYMQGLGDLDEHNGRFCTTPEYPNGTYAYFVTLDAGGNAAYPYTIGPTYYGNVVGGNTGPGSGHATPSEPVVTYTPTSDVDLDAAADAAIFPNPATTEVALRTPSEGGRWDVLLCDMSGQVVARVGSVRAGEAVTFPVANLAAGTYLVRARSGTGSFARKLIVQH